MGERWPLTAGDAERLAAAQGQGQGGRAAIGHYEQSVAEPLARGFVLHAALASERAGQFYLQRGRRALAGVYLQDAYLGFARWGATAKANQLLGAHSELLAPTSTRAARASGHVTTTTRVLNGGSLDIEGLLRAAQALAGELILDKLLDKLMRIVMLRAGAQRGFLLIPQGAQWLILDITGVRQIESSAATILVRAASALRLIGAQAILTGVRPDTAQLLVSNAADLGGLLTLGSLQSGIAYALAQTQTRGGARRA